MYLYKVTQFANTSPDAYREMIVVAPTAQHARKMHPLQQLFKKLEDAWSNDIASKLWCTSPTQTRSAIIGTATNRYRVSAILTPTITMFDYHTRRKDNGLPASAAIPEEV